MSLEEKLAANTAALELNTKALNAVAEAWNKLAGQASAIKTNIDDGITTNIAAGGTVVAEVKQEKAAAAPKAEKPAATPAATATATPTPTEAAAPAPAAASPSDTTAEHDGTPDAVTLEDVQAAVKTYGKTHRDQVLAILSKHGAAKASLLDAQHYQAVLTAVNALGEDLS